MIQGIQKIMSFHFQLYWYNSFAISK